MNHTMRATAEHLELARKITFYFDDKIVSEKAVPSGDFLTDDDCISELVEKYCSNQKGIYADLFKYHSDRVTLVGISDNFSSHINELSNDKVEQWIKWDSKNILF